MDILLVAALVFGGVLLVSRGISSTSSPPARYTGPTLRVIASPEVIGSAAYPLPGRALRLQEVINGRLPSPPPVERIEPIEPVVRDAVSIRPPTNPDAFVGPPQGNPPDQFLLWVTLGREEEVIALVRGWGYTARADWVEDAVTRYLVCVNAPYGSRPSAAEVRGQLAPTYLAVYPPPPSLILSVSEYGMPLPDCYDVTVRSGQEGYVEARVGELGWEARRVNPGDILPLD